MPLNDRITTRNGQASDEVGAISPGALNVKSSIGHENGAFEMERHDSSARRASVVASDRDTRNAYEHGCSNTKPDFHSLQPPALYASRLSARRSIRTHNSAVRKGNLVAILRNSKLPFIGPPSCAGVKVAYLFALSPKSAGTSPPVAPTRRRQHQQSTAFAASCPCSHLARPLRALKTWRANGMFRVAVSPSDSRARPANVPLTSTPTGRSGTTNRP